MALIHELLSGKSLLQLDRSYWAVKLKRGRWLSEAWTHTDLSAATERAYDWTNDLVATGDIARVTELWLLCPASATSPVGNTVRVPIRETDRAIQFKRGVFDTNLATGRKQMTAQVIGRLEDYATGEATLFVWDQERFALYAPWHVNLYDPQGLGAWRPDGMPIPRLTLAQLGGQR